MPLISRLNYIMAKAEVTYGVDSTPVGTANAVLVRNLTITPLAGERVSRDVVRPFLGASEELVATRYVQVEFEVEMAGAGAAGSLPGYDAILKACGMSGTVSAGVSVTYAPISSAFPSLTIIYNVDGVQHKITGARGNMEISVQARAIPFYKFTFTGLYNAPTDTAATAQTLTAFQTPLVVNTANTSGYSLHSYGGAMESLSINLNNEVVYRSLVGAEDVLITNRSISGTATFEAPTMAQKDYFTASLAATLGNLGVVHGVSAGNRVEIASARVSLSGASYSEMNGIHMLTVPFQMVPSASGNEFSLIVR
jgi:hypothetical protein